MAAVHSASVRQQTRRKIGATAAIHHPLVEVTAPRAAAPLLPSMVALPTVPSSSASTGGHKSDARLSMLQQRSITENANMLSISRETADGLTAAHTVVTLPPFSALSTPAQPQPAQHQQQQLPSQVAASFLGIPGRMLAQSPSDTPSSAADMLVSFLAEYRRGPLLPRKIESLSEFIKGANERHLCSSSSWKC